MKLIPKYQIGRRFTQANGNTLIDPVKMYLSRSEYDFKKDPYNRVIIPTYDEVFPDTKRFDIADESKINPAWRKKFPNAKVYNWDVYQNWVNDVENYNKKQTMQNVPNAANWYLDNERVDIGLNPVWKGNEYANGIISSIRDFAPYAFNKGVEYLIQRPMGYALDKGVDLATYLAMNSMDYVDPALWEEANRGAKNVLGEIMEKTMPSYWAGEALKGIYGDEVMGELLDSEWGKAGKTALDFYVGAKAPGIIKETPQAVMDASRSVMNTVDRGLAHFNKFRPNAVSRIVGREMMRDGLKGQSPGLTIRPTVRVKVGDVEVNNPNLAYRQGNDIGRTYKKYKDFDNSAALFSVENNIKQALKKEKYLPREPLLDEAINRGEYDGDIGLIDNYGEPFAAAGTPMYSRGRLWYGVPELGTVLPEGSLQSGLLVSPIDNNFIIGSNKALPYRGTGTGVVKSPYKTTVSTNGERLIPSDVDNLGYNLNNIEAYTWDPTYGYRRVQNNTPRVYDMNERYSTAARKNVSNAGDDVIEIPEEKTTPIDYKSYKAENFINFLTRMSASDYLTKGTPSLPYLYVGKNWARKFHENLPKEIIEELNAFTKSRMKKYRTNENFDTEFNKSLEGGYVEGNDAVFKDINIGRKEGKAKIAAFYNSPDDAVVIPERSTLGWKNDIGHEVRHRVDSKIPLTEEEKATLYDAYDEDFNLIGKDLFEEGETYDMKPEAVTTNRDATKVVLGDNYHLSLEELNARIKALPDESVFDAVRRANGYGKRYIEKLEKEGKLTPEKAQQFRNAMMKVGAFALPITIGNILMRINQTDNK